MVRSALAHDGRKIAFAKNVIVRGFPVMGYVRPVVVTHCFIVALGIDESVHFSSIVTCVGCGPAVIDIRWSQIGLVKWRDAICSSTTFCRRQTDALPRGAICTRIHPKITVESV